MRPTASVLVGLLAAAAIIVIGLKVKAALHSPHPKPRVVVHDRTTVIQTPVLTPLPRDSGPSNNQRPRTLATPIKATQPASGRQAPTRRSASTHKRRAVKTKPDHRRPSRRPSGTPPQAPSPPSQQPHQKPLVDVDVPVPVTVCVDRVGGVNCS